MKPGLRNKLIGFGALSVILALGLGIGLGVGLNQHKDSSSSASASKDTANTKSATNAVGNSTSAATASVTPLDKWSWTGDTKMLGMALGNWLVAEVWMDENYYRATNSNVWDEWTWTQSLGSDAATTLNQHWTSWITADDVKTIAEAGFNHLRIPLGFWALIPTESPEPYITSGQLAALDTIVEAAYNNNLHVLLDLHGMPGNQNGEQQSGQNTTNIQFYTAAQQTRADATVAAAISYMTSSPYSSIFSGLGVVNEPHPWSQDQLTTLEGFYERSYTTLSAQNIPMIFHHAFQGIDYWLNFIGGKDPSLLVMEDHPYPGNFPLQTNADDIVQQVCTKAQGYEAYPIPVAVTEWSLTTGLTDADFEKRFFRVQSTAWSWSGGSTYWAYKTIQATNPVLANDTQLLQYSYVDMVASGSLEPPSTWASSDSTPECGAAPTMTWASPVPAATTTTASNFKRSTRRSSKRGRRAQNIH